MKGYQRSPVRGPLSNYKGVYMNRSKQKGINTLLLLFVLSMAGFLLLCFFKLGPAYMDNQYVVEALESLAESHPDDLHLLTKTQINSELSKFYTINNVRGEITKSLEVERMRDKALISISYEVRVPLLANIDVVMNFDNVLDSSKPDECCKPSEPEE